MQISIRGGGGRNTQLGRKVSQSIRGLIPPEDASVLTHTYKNMHLCTKVPSTQAKMSNSVFFFSPIRVSNAQRAPSALSCHT